MRSIEETLALAEIDRELTQVAGELAMIKTRTEVLTEHVVVHALEVELAVAAANDAMRQASGPDGAA